MLDQFFFSCSYDGPIVPVQEEFWKVKAAVCVAFMALGITGILVCQRNASLRHAICPLFNNISQQLRLQSLLVLEELAALNQNWHEEYGYLLP